MIELYTKRRQTILSIVVASLLLAPVGCQRPTDEVVADEGSATESPPVPVEYARLGRADMTRTIGASTTVQSARNSTVQTRAAGRLTGFSLRVGDRLEVGTVVARIEAPEVGLSIEEANRAVERAQSTVDDLVPLFEQGYVARRVYDDALGVLEQARASATRAAQARTELVVAASAAGVVTEVLVSDGELVMPNQVLARLVSLEELEAAAAIPERDAALIRVGMPATIVLADATAPPVIASVVRIAPVVNARTGTVDVTIRPTASDSTLWPGMFVTAYIVVDTHADALVVPKRALVWEADQAFAFVVVPAEGSGSAPTVDRRWVELGYEDARRAEVLEGIAESELVVVTGQTALEAGDRIELVLERDDLLTESAAP